MNEKNLIDGFLSEPHKRLIAQILLEVPQRGDNLSTAEAKRFLKATDTYWKKLKAEGLVVPRYLPGKKDPVYIETELRALLSLRRYDDKIFTATTTTETIKITKEDFINNESVI